MGETYLNLLALRGIVFLVLGVLPVILILVTRFSKSKLKKAVIYLLVLFGIVLLVPFPIAYKDGGTIEFNAPLYRVIRWNKMGIVQKEYVDHIDEYWLEKTEFQLIPKKYEGNR